MDVLSRRAQGLCAVRREQVGLCRSCRPPNSSSHDATPHDGYKAQDAGREDYHPRAAGGDLSDEQEIGTETYYLTSAIMEARFSHT